MITLFDRIVSVDGGDTSGAPLTVGTTDAQPFIVRTDNTERARLAANGQMSVTAGALSGLTNVEIVDVNFNLARTVTFSGGGAAIADQRAFRVQAPTYAAAAAQTITHAVTLDVSGPPVAGSNVTISTFGVNAGAYAARFRGKVRTDDSLSIRTTTNDGMYITDTAGNGIGLFKQSTSRWYWFPQGLATTWQQFFVQEMFANITAGTDALYTIGTENARFSTISTTQTAVKSHSAFSGSRAFTSTGAVQTTAAGASNIFSVAALADNSATMVEVDVIGRDQGGANRAFAVRRACITRQAGGAATLVIATQTIGTDSLPAGYGVDIVASGNGFNVTVATGAAVTCNWACTVRYQSVSGNA